MSLAERDKKNVWHPYSTFSQDKSPIVIVKAEGTYLFDENEKKYMDAISSWWVNTHGHSHPYLLKKINEQFKKLEHVIFAGFTHQAAIELSERLLKKLPSVQSKIFFSDDGSTAVEVALKMALQYNHNKGEKKNKIIAFNNAYHGDTFGAMSVSGRTSFTDPFKNLLFEVLFIDVPVKGNEDASISQLEKILKEEENTAAFIFEPLVQGAGGMIMYNAEALDKMIMLCNKHNVITIADEVFTGFGRTGKFFAADYLDNKPDIFCLSKGLTGGVMPLGVTSCSEKIHTAFTGNDKLKTFFHGHSFTANPLACAAALASMDLMGDPETWKNIIRISEKNKKYGTEIQNAFCQNEKNKKIKEVRWIGTILAIELFNTEATSYFNTLRDKAYSYFIDKGILMRPLGNVIYIVPPYCITDNDLDYIYDTITEFINIQNV